MAGAPESQVTDTVKGRIVVRFCRKKRIDLQKKSGLGWWGRDNMFYWESFLLSGQRDGTTALKHLGSRRQGRKGWQGKVSPAKSCPTFLQSESRQAQDGLGFT